MNSKPKHIDQDAWDAVDSPELTDKELARMKPARERLKPALFEKLSKGRGAQKKPTKEAVHLRLDRDVVEHFRATGPGWQTKINRALRETVEQAQTVAGKRLLKPTSTSVWSSTKAATSIGDKTTAKASKKAAARGTSRPAGKPATKSSGKNR